MSHRVLLDWGDMLKRRLYLIQHWVMFKGRSDQSYYILTVTILHMCPSSLQWINTLLTDLSYVFEKTLTKHNINQVLSIKWIKGCCDAAQQSIDTVPILRLIIFLQQHVPTNQPPRHRKRHHINKHVFFFLNVPSINIDPKQLPN